MALLHEVRDPGNAGTVLRSADAVGADAVVFSSSSVDVYNAKTVRASAGSLFHLPVVRGPDTASAIDALRARGMRILAMDADGEGDLYEQDLSDPVAFVFGNEAWGLPKEIAALADATVRVPITGRAESLNLAAAATVCLFEWERQRREGRRAVLETIIAAAAHDIRSPLTALKGIGHALATRWEQMTREDRELMLRGIQFDTDRLNAILRQLVDAARVAAGALDLFPQRTAVAQVVEEIATSLARDPDHVRVEWAGSDELNVFVDPERLRLVLEAFVESLVWWASEGPVRVEGRVRDGRLSVEARRAETELTQDASGASVPSPRAGDRFREQDRAVRGARRGRGSGGQRVGPRRRRHAHLRARPPRPVRAGRLTRGRACARRRGGPEKALARLAAPWTRPRPRASSSRSSSVDAR